MVRPALPAYARYVGTDPNFSAVPSIELWTGYESISTLFIDSLSSEHRLPLPDRSVEKVSIAFGLRNVTDKEKALASMNRVLKPGGKLLVLEFSKPVTPGLTPLYDLYSFKILPLMGRLIANDSASYQYLAESIRMHPDQETMKGMMEKAGFTRCDYFNLTGGIVALHRGYKA